jgi:hypothetical protein
VSSRNRDGGRQGQFPAPGSNRIKHAWIAAILAFISATALQGTVALRKNPPVPETKFVEASGEAFNTIPPGDFGFFEMINANVQQDPATSHDVELAGRLAAIGIVKGKPFVPDARMKKILTDAAAVGNATGRVLNWRPAESLAWSYYPGSARSGMLWQGGANFETPPPLFTKEGTFRPLPPTGARTLESRVAFYFGYTLDSPGMIMRIPDVGSQYVMGLLDEDKNAFDGAKTCRTTLPKGIPARAFGSFTVYDNQTRSMLQTPQRFPRARSQSYPSPAAEAVADGSTKVYFAPTQPAGVPRGSWIQTGLVHDPALGAPGLPQGARRVLRHGRLAGARDCPARPLRSAVRRPPRCRHSGAVLAIAAGHCTDAGFTPYDLTDRLRCRGWQVPAYSLSPDRTEQVIQRVLVRHGVSRDLALILLGDIERAIEHLRAHPVHTPLSRAEAGGFRHLAVDAVRARGRCIGHEGAAPMRLIETAGWGASSRARHCSVPMVCCVCCIGAHNAQARMHYAQPDPARRRRGFDRGLQRAFPARQRRNQRGSDRGSWPARGRHRRRVGHVDIESRRARKKSLVTIGLTLQDRQETVPLGVNPREFEPFAFTPLRQQGCESLALYRADYRKRK